MTQGESQTAETGTSFATPLFMRLPAEKRQQILAAAAGEFAKAGFSAAKVDDMAAQAGISVGALYKYFGSKENCFLAVLDDGMKELEDLLAQVLTSKLEPWDRIEAIVRLIPEHSRRHAEIVRLYHEIGGEGLSSICREFCERFEGLSSQCYASLLSQAKYSGAVRHDLDERFAAYILDSIFMSLQFAYACDYHRFRKTVYLGADRDQDDEALCEQVIQFLKNGFTGRG